ncbi:DUF4179 domain-containing protein [Lysinibacillus sp. FSL R7-0073]|uniref:DUF4179 domain-containing protein n=1 Tax=Lysinibacillus sp. FSL R7-0073 TaxID=2921669 RepID=UPI0030FB3D5A
MSVQSKLKDDELNKLKKYIRETPVEIDLVDRVMYKYDHDSKKLITHKKKPHKVLIVKAMATVIVCLLLITPFISPTMAATIKQVPVLSSIFSLAGDLGLKTADEKGLSTKPNASVSHDGFTLSVSEVAYDGTRVSIGVERPRTASETETLMERLGNIELFINGAPIDDFAPSESNRIGIFLHPGKDKDSTIIEFSDKSNQGGRPFPEQFDLTVYATITGVQAPLKIDIPVKNKIADYVTLQPNVNRHYNNIHFTVEQIKITPITTNITTRTILTDNSTFIEPWLTMGIDIFDKQGRKLALINGNGWHETNGSEKIMDHRFTPFESVPASITIKPYIHLFKEHPKGSFQMDENNEPIIQYIPELEVTIPVK